MPLTGKIHHRVLELADGELRRGVQEIPLGSNSGPSVIQYQHSTWLGGTGWPWCVAFWQWCCAKAGLDVPWKGAGAYAALDWARKHNLDVKLDRAGVGDALVLNIGAGHLAIIAKDGPFGSTVPTINGNVSDRVKRVDWPRSSVRGAIHIPEKHSAPKPKPPSFEVVTSVNGHRKIVWSGSATGLRGALARLMKRYPGDLTIRKRKPS